MYCLLQNKLTYDDARLYALSMGGGWRLPSEEDIKTVKITGKVDYNFGIWLTDELDYATHFENEYNSVVDEMFVLDQVNGDEPIEDPSIWEHYKEIIKTKSADISNLRRVVKFDYSGKYSDDYMTDERSAKHSVILFNPSEDALIPEFAKVHKEPEKKPDEPKKPEPHPLLRKNFPELFEEWSK